MTMDVGWRFDSARLSRTEKGWRYVGRVHEYLSGPKGRGAPSQRVPSTYIKFKVTDQSRRAEQEYTILRILQEETAEKPFDTRSSFYLARTYNVVGNHSAALAEFQRRVSLGGWKEEIYESLYAIAWQKDALKAPWHEVQQAFLDAHAHSSERAEPLYAIASHYHREHNAPLAYLFASHASTLAYPTHASLWVQADVYAWQCWFIIGMSGLDIGRGREGAAALTRALAKRPNDSAMQQQMALYRKMLGAATVDAIACEVDSARCSTPEAAAAAAAKKEAAERSAVTTVPGKFAATSVDGVAPSESSGGSPWIFALVAVLLVSNLALVVALKKGKAVAACLPPSMIGPDKQV